MSDEIDEPIPECGQCNDYFKVQQIKTARIKELQKQLEVSVEVLRFYADPGIYDHVHSARIGVNNECGDKAREALKKIGEVGK